MTSVTSIEFMQTSSMFSNRVSDARAAMQALIATGKFEQDASFPETIAGIAWEIADAMGLERQKRTGHGSVPPPSSSMPPRGMR